MHDCSLLACHLILGANEYFQTAALYHVAKDELSNPHFIRSSGIISSTDNFGKACTCLFKLPLKDNKVIKM